MKKLTVVVLLFVVIASIGILSMKPLMSRVKEGSLFRGSEGERIKGSITVAGDNYFGYWFITSKEFKDRLRQKGYSLNWVNDGGNYSDRHEKFSQGKYDIIVLPVNSYLYHGKASYYPGIIVAAISDSKGADSVVAYKEKIVGQAQRELTVNDLNNPNLKFGMTPDSPSSFLLNVAIVQFGLDKLKNKGNWYRETKGSRDAYEKFAKGELEVAVLWEPDVSKALVMPGVVRVFGSDQVSQMIIDVFVVRRDLADKDPQKVLAFFEAYFQTLAYYNSNHDQMLSEMEKHPDFKSRKAAESALSRIAWFDLKDNLDWFAISIPGVNQTIKSEKIVNTIVQVTDVMVDIGDLASDPLKGNPYVITNSAVLKQLSVRMSPEATAIGATVPVNIIFAALSNEEWSRLKLLGTMRILPILFQSGTATLTPEGKNVVDEAAVALVNNYPQYRVLIKGHTAPSGDENANVFLSQQRADAVKQYLAAVYSIDSNRILAQGIGSREQLQRQVGEGELSYRSRLARVEFILLEDK